MSLYVDRIQSMCEEAARDLIAQHAALVGSSLAEHEQSKTAFSVGFKLQVIKDKLTVTAKFALAKRFVDEREDTQDIDTDQLKLGMEVVE